jgi:putative transposase
MPWSETSAMDQKRLFIKDYIRGSFGMAELCRRYGIGRPTGYKWVARFEDSGLSGLEERSRRPKGCSHETAIEITEAVLEFRRKHPYWGAKKILSVLEKRHPLVSWPARSTVCDLLSRHGMIDRKRRRRYPGHPGEACSIDGCAQRHLVRRLQGRVQDR